MMIRPFYRLSFLLEPGSPFREQRPDRRLRIESSLICGEVLGQDPGQYGLVGRSMTSRLRPSRRPILRAEQHKATANTPVLHARPSRHQNIRSPKPLGTAHGEPDSLRPVLAHQWVFTGHSVVHDMADILGPASSRSGPKTPRILVVMQSPTSVWPTLRCFRGFKTAKVDLLGDLSELPSAQKQQSINATRQSANTNARCYFHHGHHFDWRRVDS